MRVMVIVKATKESEAESNPFEMEGAEEMFEQMGKFNEELIKAGIMLVGDGLKPSKFGKRIHFSWDQAVGDRRPLRRDEGAGGGVLDLAGPVDGRGDRVGQAVPQPDAGSERPRDPPDLGGGGLRPRDRGGDERASRQDREEHQVGRSPRCRAKNSPSTANRESAATGKSDAALSVAPPGLEPGLS